MNSVTSQSKSLSLSIVPNHCVRCAVCDVHITGATYIILIAIIIYQKYQITLKILQMRLMLPQGHNHVTYSYSILKRLNL